MIRIALIVTGLERGGAELQVVQLATALQSRGWDIAVFALRPGPLADELGRRGITAAPLHRILAFRPHVLHAHLFHANLAARLARLFLLLTAVISTVHSLAESNRRSGRIRFRDLAYRLTDALSNATVFVSTAVANRHLAVSAVTAARTHVIPNGVDTGHYRPDPDRRARTRAALGLTEEFVWLAAGRLMWKKNYPLLLRAMERQRGSVLLIAGEGPDEAALRSEAPATVRFLGVRTDTAELMNAADALVLSSVVEGLPMVLLEAAASGLPCVATAVGGVSEAVLASRTGYLVAPGDIDALSNAMALVTALSAGEREAMSREAREYALARFDLQAVVEQWEHLYTALLAEES